ncbi:serine palmitoyltransferase [Colletotrichum sp. SAR11_57]|nr:serine palmitoyltransferase [Colletotrichum sp. SAR11_57]
MNGSLATLRWKTTTISSVDGSVDTRTISLLAARWTLSSSRGRFAIARSGRLSYPVSIHGHPLLAPLQPRKTLKARALKDEVRRPITIGQFPEL